MKLSFLRIAGVLGVGLVVLLALRTLRDRAAASRYAAAQERALAACRVYRDEPSHVDADVCRFDQFGPLTFKQFHVAEAQLVEARAAFARRAIVADARLEAAARPFERERVHALWILSQYHRYQFEQDEPAATGALVDEMESDEPAFHEMTDATLAGDIPGCEEAAARLGTLVGINAVLGRQCALLAEAAHVRARLDAM